ncbi:MAG TPA: fructose-1,6-bisphosphate aldolase/phosphatase [Planctomycetota bacterium]|nr:fructose-1,6-bisphosphate aldolase/phosphatase [Planctomycetota bacterium]
MGNQKKLTLSVIKADVGGYVGHCTVHPDLMATAEKKMDEAKKKKLVIDYRVLNCGDDIQLIMTHHRGEDSAEIHGHAWNTFKAATETAKQLKMYGAGQDLLSDAFSGNVKGMGPGVAEMEFEERKSEPVLIFMADKCSPGAWNLPVFRMFADPFCSPGLVIDTSMHQGNDFQVADIHEKKSITLRCPDEMYDLLMFIGAVEKFMIERVYRRSDGEIAAAASTQKLSLIAGKYVGKDDPVLVVRAQSGFPAVGEILEPFAFPHAVAGWTRGSHYGPLMPVAFRNATPSRLDGPPRVICAGFQLAEGRLIGPRDMFDDPIFDRTREMASEVGEWLRRHGPFEPHRLPLEEMEYTTMPQIMKKLASRFVAEKPKANGKPSAPAKKKTALAGSKSKEMEID